MSQFEGQLLTRITDTGDVRSALKAITSDHFFKPESRQAWNFIREYFTVHGQAPSREMLVASVPMFEFEPAFDPVPALVERVHEFFVYNTLNGAMEHVAELAKSDTMGAAKYMADQAMKFRSLSSKRVGGGIDLTQSVKEEIDAYYMRKNLKGVLGIAWPWARLNRATFGLQDGQLIIFYARPKQMKTWLLLKVIEHCHYNAGRRVVIFTREMTVEEIRRRFCALWAAIDYDRYLRGTLTNADERRWVEAMEAFAESPPVVIETVSGSGEEAADEMIAKAQELGSDLMAVDGIYFYGNREWEIIARFTSRLKYHLLNSLKIPCVGTSQGAKAKTGKDNLDDVGYGDSISQDADVLIKCALVQEDERIYLSLPGIRESKGCEFSVWARPAYDFRQAFVDNEEGPVDNRENEDKDPYPQE